MPQRAIKSYTAVLIIPLAEISKVCALDKKVVGTPSNGVFSENPLLTFWLHAPAVLRARHHHVEIVSYLVFQSNTSATYPGKTFRSNKYSTSFTHFQLVRIDWIMILHIPYQ